MKAQPIETYAADSIDALIKRLDEAYDRFANLARDLRDSGRLNGFWTDPLDDPPRDKSFGGAIAHVISHNMHHRAEALHMMHRLGMTDVPKGNLMGWDFMNRTQNR